MRPWLIGNTTLRNPFRLSDGLAVLRDSKFNGSLLGVPEQEGFVKLLQEKGVLRTAGGDHIGFYGRKWRAAMYQLGFITHALTRLDANNRDPLLVEIAPNVKGLSGLPYEITPNGSRLAEAEATAECYDCFLRALVAYQLPSIAEPDFGSPRRFAPLFIVLQILERLPAAGQEARISFEEMASIVMFSQDHDAIQVEVNELIEFRKQRLAASKKRSFEAAYRLEAMQRKAVTVSSETLRDYADTNFRYLKATGLFTSSGLGITVTPEKAALVVQLLAAFNIETDDRAYLQRLYNGASLPTDSQPEAVVVVNSLAQLLREVGQQVELPVLNTLSVEELNQFRFRLETEFSNVREEAYAAEQRAKWPEILAELRDLAGMGRKRRGAEAPAYFEWAVWRAFLAINSLVNKPWQSRRFKVDQDFLPISTAPGNGPDSLFEFDDFVIVSEVTFTSNSRQEAAEGEPVRRHVANEVERREGSEKEVYGLFIANEIDSNTAETFRQGTWFKKDDSKVNLAITPLTIDQFCRLFEACFTTGSMEPNDIRRVIRDCRVHSNNEGPQWKQKIAQEIERNVKATAARAAGIAQLGN